MSSEWVIVDAKNNFEKYQASWECLGKEVLGIEHPLANVDYVSPLLEKFGTDDIKLALCGDSGMHGMVLLQKKASGVWETFTPNTGPFTFALISQSGGSVEKKIKTLMQAIPGTTMLLGFNKLDPDNLVVPVGDSWVNSDRVDYFQTLRISTDRSFEEYWSSRGKNLRRDITKKINRLKKNEIEFELIELSQESDIYKGVERYGALEALGWKGKLGTAVDVNAASGKFYVDMLGRFAERKSAAVYQLMFDDKVVASALTIKSDGMFIVLKITFDEQLKEFSPGLMMMYELHKKAFSMEDVNSIEHYGKLNTRSQQWADETRMLYHMNVYRYPTLKTLHKLLRKLRTRQ